MLSISKARFGQIFFLALVTFICWKSYGNAFGFYYWKDDWAWLWSANFNPRDFYGTTIGPTWQIRTGLFMYPYVLFLHRVIRDSLTWQYIGFFLKLANSLAFFFFVSVITKKRHLAVFGSLLYASYSGGIESYTWHKLNALVTFFVLIGMTFYAKFSEKFYFKNLIISYFFFLMAFFSYVGRATGLVLVVLFWNFLLFIDKVRTRKEKKLLLFSSLLLVVPFLLFAKFVFKEENTQGSYLIGSLPKINYFIGIIGNLVRNPFFRIDETGYLTGFDRISYAIGYWFFGVGIFAGLAYLKRGDRKYFLVTLFIGWVFLFYITNWLFGGGGITTYVSSGHRYVALAGVGVVTLYVLVLSRLKKFYGVIFFGVILLANLNYSKYLIASEGALRNKDLVLPIYQEIITKTHNNDDVRVLLIDTPNKLKSYVVQGWLPYTFVYFRGERDFGDFPTVIPHWEMGVEWLCGDQEMRDKIESVGGFVDYQKGSNFTINDIYAWTLYENGRLEERTTLIRKLFEECQK